MPWFLCILLPILFFSGTVHPFRMDEDWISLFNSRNLSGWDTYLGPPFDSLGNKTNDLPIGLNRDPNHVFSVVENEGEKIIRISGENFGAISTQAEFENYHIQLMFKWGQLKWPPKKDKKRDSGLLYHSVGPQGADFGFWMRSQEFQIEEGNCGDYWGVAGGIADIPSIRKSDSEYVYDSKGSWYSFRAGSKTGRRCMKKTDAEKTSGEWNTLDLFVSGDTSVHMINGKLMMVLYHSRQEVGGKELPLSRGKIQIQSEGAEIFYKQIRIKKLVSLPHSLIAE